MNTKSPTVRLRSRLSLHWRRKAWLIPSRPSSLPVFPSCPIIPLNLRPSTSSTSSTATVASFLLFLLCQVRFLLLSHSRVEDTAARRRRFEGRSFSGATGNSVLCCEGSKGFLKRVRDVDREPSVRLFLICQGRFRWVFLSDHNKCCISVVDAVGSDLRISSFLFSLLSFLWTPLWNFIHFCASLWYSWPWYFLRFDGFLSSLFSGFSFLCLFVDVFLEYLLIMNPILFNTSSWSNIS